MNLIKKQIQRTKKIRPEGDMKLIWERELMKQVNREDWAREEERALVGEIKSPIPINNKFSLRMFLP